ncbi:PfkB-like carbohydrate kinase family protein [Tanacetum coccineum]
MVLRGGTMPHTIVDQRDQTVQVLFLRPVYTNDDNQIRSSTLTIFDIISEAKVFHYGSISLIVEPCRPAHLKAMEVAKEAGTLLSYDQNPRLPLWPFVCAANSPRGKTIVVKVEEEEEEKCYVEEEWKGKEARERWEQNIRCRKNRQDDGRDSFVSTEVVKSTLGCCFTHLSMPAIRTVTTFGPRRSSTNETRTTTATANGSHNSIMEMVVVRRVRVLQRNSSDNEHN